MAIDLLEDDTLKLKAAVEFGADYTYTIRQGTLGRSIYANAYSRKEAAELRKKMPPYWEGLRTMVLYHASGPPLKDKLDEFTY